MSDTQDPPTTPPRTLADRLNRLFADIRPDPNSTTMYSNDHVADAIKATNPGIRCGGSYLSSLRRGKKDNPTGEVLTALAKFFGVPESYLLDEEAARKTDVEFELAEALRNAKVKKLALRAAHLGERELAAVTELVDNLRKIRDADAPQLPPRDE